MRLTAELIQNSLSYINPLNERELDLRGHKIPTIENLGVARDQDAIDFTDNAITTLGNFPLSPRLTTLLLAHNRVSVISASLASSVPRLHTLVLAHNRLANLADIDPLGQLPNLVHLVLVENPLVKLDNYRLWVLWRCRNVRFLDYVKVKDAERQQAIELFGEDGQSMTKLAQSIASSRSGGGAASAGSAASGGANGATGRVKLTAKERKRVETMIRNAKSLAEIARLEKELNEGRIPGGVLQDESSEDEDAMEQ